VSGFGFDWSTRVDSVEEEADWRVGLSEVDTVTVIGIGGSGEGSCGTMGSEDSRFGCSIPDDFFLFFLNQRK